MNETDTEAVVDDPTTRPLDHEEEKELDESQSKQQNWFKRNIVGDYNYGALFTPRWNPWKQEDTASKLRFYGPDSKVAPLLAMFLGFQHSLAVVGGTVIPGILLGNLDPKREAGRYLVSYALITSGICTWIQIAHTPIFKTGYFLGSGLLCVIATSFAFLPTAMQSIETQMNEGKTFDEAYGSLLGVFMVGAIFQSSFSFIPPRFLRRIFPPWLAGMGVFLIGVSLVRVGVQSWGGGADCANNLSAPCTQVGDSELPFGSAEYIGLGFLVISTLVVIELFGSPFMRSCALAIALLFGYFIASVTADRNGDSYTDLSVAKEADTALFLWIKRFPIGFYTPALLPTLIAYVVSTIETYGDTTATAEASGYKPNSAETGKRFDEAIQGGLLGDSVNSFFSAVAMVLPSTTLSQNIGIISLTNVASRTAGYACGGWMIVYGIFGPVGSFFTSIPQPVLGGMSTFLFTNIAISGIKVMTTSPINRRERFILAIACSFGIGTITVPQWFNNSNFLNCIAIENPAGRGVCDAVVLTLSTGYAVGCLVALALNAILPAEENFNENDRTTTSNTKDETRNIADSTENAEQEVAEIVA